MMLRGLPVLISVCMLALGGGGNGRASDANVRMRTLANGLRVVAVRTAADGLVAVDIWLQAGSALETESEQGAAHFLEHMLFKGTSRRKAGEVDVAVEMCGGMANAGTTRDAAHVFVTVNAGSLEAVLPVLADAVRSPALDTGEMELERGVILDEFARRLNVATIGVQDAAFSLAYPGTAMARPVLGTPEAIRRLTAGALRSFHERAYQPDRCTIVIAGDMMPERAAGYAEDAFGDWPRSTFSTSSSAGTLRSDTGEAEAWKPMRAGPLTLPSAGGESAREMLVWRTPPAAQADDLLAAELAAAILEDVAAREVASRGQAGVELVHGGRGGVLCLWYAPEQKRLRGKLETALQRLAETGPESAELAAARRAVAGRYLYESETAAGLARLVGTWALLGDAELPLRITDRLARLTSSAVRDFVRKCLPAGPGGSGVGS